MAETKATVSWPEFRRWVQFFERQPWGCASDDLRFGVLASAICTALGAKSATPSALFPWLLPEGEQEPEVDWSAKERMLAARMQVAGVMRQAAPKAR